MYILHSVKKNEFENGLEYYGEKSIKEFEFIHCSDLDTYYLVAPNFKEDMDERVLLVIDVNKVKSPIKWEKNCGIKFPHIYGLLNKDAIVAVLPHLWDEKREWIPNDELKDYLSKLQDNLYRKI